MLSSVIHCVLSVIQQSKSTKFNRHKEELIDVYKEHFVSMPVRVLQNIMSWNTENLIVTVLLLQSSSTPEQFL